MTINTINRIKTIAHKLSASDNSIVTIYQNTGLTINNELIPNYKIISFNCFIKNLRAFSLIRSLAEISLPSFNLEDSETDKLYKTLDVEWKSARKQITLYISNQLNTNSSGEGWFKVGSLSLLNPSGYPYRIYNLMDLFTDSIALELGDNGKIGIQIEDVGYGLLEPTDEITIHGSYIEEIFVQSPDPTYVNIVTGNVTPPTPQPVVDSFPLDTLFRISANSLQLTDNQLVTTWRPSNISNLIAIQEIEINKPVYKANILNNRSAVYFDGTNKFLNIRAPNNSSASIQFLPINSDWLIFLVIKFDRVTTGLSIFNLDIYQANDININGNRINKGYIDEYGNYREIFYEYPSVTDWLIIAISNVNDSTSAYINGTKYQSSFDNSTPTYDTNDLGKTFIGCRTSNSNYLNGYIADIVIIGMHNDTDINTIGNYYKNLYNLIWNNI